MKISKTFHLIFLLVALYSCSQTKTSSENKDTTDASKPQMVLAPGKKAMILQTDRPPNLETPLHYFLLDFTPNDVFFVRWHLANMPEQIGEDTFRLRIGGNVKKPLALSLADLKKKFKPHTVNALCLCAGNSRSCLNPRVPGVQWTNGGMGNAQWKGVKLKDILALTQPKANSKFVAFNGLDAPPLSTIPDFIKSLDYSHAIDGEVMIAYEMNGEPLPVLNGYPLKLVVPGCYATYWIGMLNEVKIYADSFKGYWMDKNYLVPRGVANGNENPDSLTKDLVPISKIAVRSIFVSPEPESILKKGDENEIQGLAFDGDDGIAKVEISMDGKTWNLAKLDASLGNYSWRRWRYQFNPAVAGKYTLYAKATNIKGQTQPLHHWNRSGYMRNEIETLTLIVK